MSKTYLWFMLIENTVNVRSYFGRSGNNVQDNKN